MLKSFSEIPDVRGELMDRVLLNAARLCAPIYRPDAIYTQDKNGWPGDWEGRTLLALVSHMKCLGKEPAYLSEILSGIPSHLNEKGYLGRILPAGLFDEQQLSGHNWLLRGLLEYYTLTKDEKVYSIAKSIVENLYLPLKGYYRDYPLDPNLRDRTGSYSGTVSDQIGNFILSTDIGCALMCLDGLSRFYEISKDVSVLDLLKEMVSVFVTIDFVGSHMQTHATLSALRGIICLYKSTGERNFLDRAVSIFEIYLSYGMTENYANFNWFGRYDTWTEPCAITDSLMVSTELYKITGNVKYLTLANRIYFNAFCYAQRYNGGFGTDNAVGPAGKYLKPNGGGISEAYWCCTMRGAEGLSCMCENAVLTDENGDVYIPFGGSFRCAGNDIDLSFESKIPYDGYFKVTVTAFKNSEFSLMVYTGNGFKKMSVKLNSGETKCFESSFEIKMHDEEAFTTAGIKHLYGNLLLGSKNPNVPPLYVIKGLENGLEPLSNMKDVMPEDVQYENRQILF